MSEKILKALMQLFAIIARGNELSNDRRNVVRLFLQQQLNRERVEEFLNLFDHFLSETPEKKKIMDAGVKRTSVKDSVRVLRICTQINSELEQKQKVVVLIRILEFISTSSTNKHQEFEFATTVASTFNVSDDEFKNILMFCTHSEKEEFNSAELLTVDSNQTASYEKKHIFSEGLNGKLEILQVKSVSMFLLRQFGEEELYLNGQPLLHEQVHVLTPGCSIRNSRVAPLYYSDIASVFIGDKGSSGIVFKAKDLEYIFPNGHQGLQKFNLIEESGRMVGIMGSSGSGKSTLLNVLNGSEVPTKGTVQINGINIHTDKDKIEGLIGNVSQDDLLIDELSVYQNLYYNAKLCFGGVKDEEIHQRVDKLLEDLGLYEIRHLKVGNPLNKKISGGQRKRLNIGLELIREPSVLFVDEPTSGLSSRDSENIMDLLKQLSLKGKLVFVVIHQPSSDIFKMFDSLLILDSGGYLIYSGNPVDGVSYFKHAADYINSEASECLSCGNVNPEQIFDIIELKVIDEYGNPTRQRKIAPREWYDLIQKHPLPEHHLSAASDSIPKNLFRIPGWMAQFRVFISRDVLSKLSNVQYMTINFLEAPFLAFILAFMVKYYHIAKSGSYIFRENENLPAYLFMAVIVALFMGLTVSAEEIIRDRKILKRESFLNLSRSSYLLSKITILILISAIQTLCFVLVGNYILEIKGMNTMYWIVLFSTSCFANLMGLNISATFDTAVTIYILIPILLIPQLLLSGVIVKFDKLNPLIASEEYVPLAGELMASRWAFEALAVEQFMDNEYEERFYNFDKAMSRSEYIRNYWIPTLKEKIATCLHDLREHKSGLWYDADLALIRNEIKNEASHYKHLDVACTDSLQVGNFNERIALQTEDVLKKIFDIQVKIFNTNNEHKDRIISAMQTDAPHMESFRKLNDENENDALSDLVRNDKSIDRITEEEGRLIQKMHPVFADPSFKNAIDFRAHFFAPRKQFAGRYFSTLQVNMVMLWAMTMLLAITLYYETFRKLIELSGSMLSKLSSLFQRQK